MKNKILKKTATLLLSVILLFFGLTMIGQVSPGAFDGLETVSANSQMKSEVSEKLLSVSDALHLDNLNLVDTAHAEETPQINTSDTAKNTYNKMISVVVVIVELLSTLLWPILLLIGALLKNDILFSGGMEQTMLNIWVNIRNLVNILFILVLLGIAFYNVVGGSAEDYQIKSVLPKFIIALIAVNFSFLGVKVLADTVNVFTIAIFALPNTVQTELKTLSAEGVPNAVCTEWSKRSTFLDENPKKVNPSATAEPAEKSLGLIDFERMCEKQAGKETYSYTSYGKQFFETFSANNAALVMAIDMGKIININEVKLKQTSENPIMDLAINMLLTVILYIVYTSGFLALFVILVVRMVLLWVTAVLSPIVVLRYVLPESLKSAIGGGDDLSKKLIQSIIAPIPIALMMTIGFIMFQSLKATSMVNSVVNTGVDDFNLLTSGLSTLQDLIIAVGMVAVVWMGVFAAASGTFAEEAVNGIKGAVSGAGKFIATAPFKYLPLIPIRQGGKDDAVSAGVALGALSQMPQAMESDMYDKSRKLSDRILNRDQHESLKFDGANSLEEIANRLKKSGSPVDKGAQQKLYQHLDKNRKLLGEMAPRFGMKPEELLEALKSGNADKTKLREYINDKASYVPKTPAAETFDGFKPNTPASQAALNAFEGAQQGKLGGNKSSASADEKEKIGGALTTLNQTWATGSQTAVNQLEGFVNGKKDAISTALQGTGMSAVTSNEKAKQFLIAMLEERKKTANDAEKTEIDKAINSLKGVTNPPATGGTGTPPPPPPTGGSGATPPNPAPAGGGGASGGTPPPPSP